MFSIKHIVTSVSKTDVYGFSTAMPSNRIDSFSVLLYVQQKNTGKITPVPVDLYASKVLIISIGIVIHHFNTAPLLISVP